MMILLDTNVVSELRKIRVGKADVNVARWAESLDTATLFVSVITIHELELGILLAERRDPLQGTTLRHWLDRRVMPAFRDRILPVDVAVGRRAALCHVPKPHPINDALIAATALVHGMIVATRNIADFRGTGVAVLNPWEAPG